MPSTYTTNLGIELPADGELDGVWGDVVNENMDILDRAINGSVALTLSGTTSTLTTSDGALSDGQYKLLVLGGTPSGTHTITIAPNDAQKIYFVRNTTAQSVVFTQGSGGNVTIATGDNAIIYSDGAGAGAAVVNITNDFAMSSVKITGGTIDGTTIGGSSPAVGTFTTANATTVDTTNIEVTTLKAKDGTSAGSIADSTGVVTLASSVLTTTDINGGTIDGTVIGGSSAAAGTFTTVTASGDVTIADKIVHSGDTNTSIRFPAADTVTVETSGFERMRIDSSGNVGIGVSPATDGAIHVHRSGASFPTIKITNGTTGTANSDGFDLVCGSAGEAYVYNRENQPLIFGTNATERMRISSAGLVGIGTASPGAILELNAGTNSDIRVNTSASGYLQLGQFSNGAFISTSSSDATAGILRLGTGGSEKMRISVAGNVGIGTSSPARPLDVNGTARLADGAVLEWGGTTTRISGSSSTNTLILATNNAERMRIDSSGNVGIGTTSPVYKLVVSAAGASGIEFGPAYSGTANLIQHYSRSGGVYVDAVNDAAQHRFATSGTERLRIDSSGNVGIGTSSPSADLSVGSITTSSGDVHLRTSKTAVEFTPSNSDAGGMDFNVGWVAGGQGPLKFSLGSTERMRIDSSGNVGIGTSTAHYATSGRTVFNINGTTSSIIGMQNGNDTAGYLYADSGTLLVSTEDSRQLQLLVTGSAAMTFGTNNTERMRIDASGNLLVGTTSNPSGYKIIANGTVSSNTASGTAPSFLLNQSGVGAAQVFVPASTNALAFGVFDGAGIPERVRIGSGGEFLVGTTSSSCGGATVRQHVSATDFCLGLTTAASGNTQALRFAYGTTAVGSVTLTGSTTTYNTSSDYRLKENVAPMQNALDTVAQLNPVTYTWKADGSAGQGFIAHELQAVVPDCVTGQKDAVDETGNPQYQGVDTSFLVATLVKAIQELKAEVDSLRAQLNP
jgi:hypothetical protein